jgi:FkbM family methyltransferase
VYSNLLRVRNEIVDGVKDWSWIASDNGAWDGPKMDWETSHKTKYYEYVKKFDVCIQAGGNQGMYPRLLSEKFASVYTFEPDPLNFHCLVNNCQKDNIYKFNAALGSTLGEVFLSRGSMTNTGTHTVNNNNGFKIIQMTIDSLNLSACDLIALDIEGYEEQALKGAIKTIEKYKPVIAAERGVGSMQKVLEDLGYVYRGNSVSDQIFSVN